MAYADVAGIRLNYELEGDESHPVLVFSHSIGADLSMWNRVLPALSGRFRLLCYDTRGHGKSSVMVGNCSIADLGNDVLALMDHLRIERCVFCGLSLGGMTAMWLAIHAPHRVERLILANTAARIGTREMWNQRIHDVEQGGVWPVADAVLERWFTADFRRDSPEIVEAVRRRLAVTQSQGYISCAAAIRDAGFTEDLHRIETPSLVVASTYDKATTAEQGRMLAQGIRAAKYVELKTAHLSAVEDPAGFSRALLGFLDGSAR